MRGEWEPKSRVAARTPITPCLIRVRLARSRAISHGEFVLLPVHSKNRQKRFESSADRRPSQFPGSNVSSRFPIEQLLFFDHSPFNPLSSYLHTLYFSFNTNILAVITGACVELLIIRFLFNRLMIEFLSFELISSSDSAAFRLMWQLERRQYFCRI